MSCRVSGCDKPASSREMCWGHYMRWYRYGHPLAQPKPKATPDERMMKRVAVSDVGCWFYDTIISDRRPRLTRDGRLVPVRELVYRHVVGPIPEGMVLVPTCTHMACVRPDHNRLAERSAA